MTYSALASKHPMRKAVTTQPDFYTVFGSGVTIGAPSYTVAKHVHQDITGTDSVTGFAPSALNTIYGASTDYECWGIGDMADAADMDSGTENETYFNNSLAAAANPIVKGARQLTNSCLVRVTGAPNPQTHLYVGIQSAAALADPVQDQYWEIDFILPAGLDLQAGDTATGKFFSSPIEFKTGAWYDTGTASYKQAVGDFRIGIGVTGTDTGGVNRWYVAADNEANGRGTIPEVGAALVSFVDIVNTDEDVQLGVRTKVKVWYRRPVDANDLTSGRLRVDIKPEGSEAFTLCNITSGYQLCGQVNLPITRLFFGSNYTSAVLPNATVLESLVIYNNPSDSLLNSLFR